METETLTDLITKKGFENYQGGLKARFLAHRMIYEYEFKNDRNYNSILVTLNKSDIKIQIEIKENGELVLQYNLNGLNQVEEFKNCGSEDFHTMIAYSFIYLRNGNFNVHKDWYNKLDKK